MSYQFIHIEDYGINISKKRSNNGTSEKYKKETKGRSVSQIISEAKRDSSISQVTHNISLPDFPPKSGIFLFV